MKDIKDVKIAMIFGKGLDGCGVQRGAVEISNWAQKSGVQFDIYEMTGRAFMRAKGHDMPTEPIKFDPKDIPRLTEKLNSTYDIVILNSYPSGKHSQEAVMSFYNNLVKKITHPVLVGMMHEIRGANIDKIPLIVPILNYCDIVYNFSTKTDFSKKLASIYPSKILNERVRRFSMYTDVDKLKADFREKFASIEKEKRMIYVGRWTSMKDPRRMLELYPIMQKKDPTFGLALHGIEKSIGAKADIIDHPNCRFNIDFKGDYNWQAPGVPVFGPYKYADGMREIASSMFASSFFRLPKDPQNYGDRMEYTQIEIIGCGTIPVFDKHYGENNYDSLGNKYNQTDSLAVWSNKNDLEETCDQLIQISNDPNLQKRYLDSGIAFIEQEFDAKNVMPAMIAEILSVGKDYNKFVNDNSLIPFIFNDEQSFFDFENLSLKSIPAIGLKETDNKALRVFTSKKGKREDYKDYSKPKIKKSKVK